MTLCSVSGRASGGATTVIVGVDRLRVVGALGPPRRAAEYELERMTVGCVGRGGLEGSVIVLMFTEATLLRDRGTAGGTGDLKSS